MNAMSSIPLPEPAGDAGYVAACAVLADAKIGDALDRLGDQMAAIYEPRRCLTQGEATAASDLRKALADLVAARALLAPIMAERVQ
jgi:hypothetical protein